jgi:hypothetical protein
MMRNGACVIALAALVLGSAGLAAADDDYVAWEGVRFGMTAPELREIHPETRPVEALDEQTANTSLPWENHFLSKQPFGRLEGCLVHFMLLEGHLARMNFYCARYSPKEVHRVLEDRYGFASAQDDIETAWHEGPARIGMNRNSGFFGIGHASRAEAIVGRVLGPRYQERLKLQRLLEGAARQGADAEGGSGAREDGGSSVSGDAGTKGDKSASGDAGTKGDKSGE